MVRPVVVVMVNLAHDAILSAFVKDLAASMVIASSRMIRKLFVKRILCH